MSPRILLFTGKGGVGKTTAAAASALRLADRGQRTLVVSTDTAHSLGDALDVRLGDDPTEVAANLWAVQVDTQGRFEASWRDVQTFLIDLLAKGGVDPISADELTVLPGLDEVLALLAVRELAVAGDWDVLVVDCAPTAETLRLLALPEALGWYLDRVFPAQRKIARTMRPLATVLGKRDAIPPDTIFEALLRLADELQGVRQLLGDPAITSVRLVLTPETVVTAEARRTFTALALYGYSVDQVIANRVFPTDGADPWRAAWARSQQRQLVAVRESFAGLPVRELPYRDAEPVGEAALRELAEALYGPLPGTDPAPPSDNSRLLHVESTADGFRLELALPLAERSDVEVARAGDDLIVGIGTYRRVLHLPAVLRRCEVTGGHYDGRALNVRFRPDPARWPSGRPTPYGRPPTSGSRHRRARPRPGAGR
ncbi:ArsA family ATPase [Jatrophihabitans fulvus]